MMKFLRIPLFLLMLLSLAACAPRDMRLVDAVDARHFVNVSRSMRPVMLQKRLVDEAGSWYSPVIVTRPENVGRVLVDYLSPAFLGTDSFEEDTFRASLTSEARVQIAPCSASIRQDGKLTELELIAVTDWNGDDQDDWLVSCRTGNDTEPQIYREYILVLTEVGTPVIQPRLLLVQDVFHGKETVLEEPFHREMVDSRVDEYLQGQTVVT
ncbi:MAG: hypothetical protein IKJ34_08300, partial [Mailhella sp.]|nr:hypothetical protein [Mailhella sp.]